MTWNSQGTEKPKFASLRLLLDGRRRLSKLKQNDCPCELFTKFNVISWAKSIGRRFLKKKKVLVNDVSLRGWPLACLPQLDVRKSKHATS